MNVIGRDHVIEHAQTKAFLRFRVWLWTFWTERSGWTSGTFGTGLNVGVWCARRSLAESDGLLVASSFLEPVFLVQKAASKPQKDAFYAILPC